MGTSSEMGIPLMGYPCMGGNIPCGKNISVIERCRTTCWVGVSLEIYRGCCDEVNTLTVGGMMGLIDVIRNIPLDGTHGARFIL